MTCSTKENMEYLSIQGKYGGCLVSNPRNLIASSHNLQASKLKPHHDSSFRRQLFGTQHNLVFAQASLF